MKTSSVSRICFGEARKLSNLFLRSLSVFALKQTRRCRNEGNKLGGKFFSTAKNCFSTANCEAIFVGIGNKELLAARERAESN
jgi:hypothetical protein